MCVCVCTYIFTSEVVGYSELNTEEMDRVPYGLLTCMRDDVISLKCRTLIREGLNIFWSSPIENFCFLEK